MGVLAAMAMMVSPSFTRTARADAGIAQVLDAIRSARETGDQSAAERRACRFIRLDAIQTVRQDIGVDGVARDTTILRTVQLENRMEFRLDPAVAANTPDAVPAQRSRRSRSEPAAARRMFTSEGTFVDQHGDVLNGTLFLSIPNQATAPRAITVMGATALIRTWRWNGREWVE